MSACEGLNRVTWPGPVTLVALMLLQGLSPETSDHMCTAKAVMALDSLKQNGMTYGTAVTFIKADFHHQPSWATMKGARRCFVSQSGRGIVGKLSPW